MLFVGFLRPAYSERGLAACATKPDGSVQCTNDARCSLRSAINTKSCLGPCKSCKSPPERPVAVSTCNTNDNLWFQKSAINEDGRLEEWKTGATLYSCVGYDQPTCPYPVAFLLQKEMPMPGVKHLLIRVLVQDQGKTPTVKLVVHYPEVAQQTLRGLRAPLTPTGATQFCVVLSGSTIQLGACSLPGASWQLNCLL